jgi:DNA-binding PadR family transcriptional regulator
MLSKINTLLLGLIAQKPLNPYEIQKVLNKINIRNWLPIAESSVYAGIRSLNENGCVQGEIKKDKNMPEKTVYGLTDKGSQILKTSIEQFLSNLDFDPVMFNIGIFLMGQLNKNDVIAILTNKLKNMDQATFALKKQLDETPMPYVVQAMVKHQIYLMFSEAKTIREILEKIEHDSNWNDHLALDLYEN